MAQHRQLEVPGSARLELTAGVVHLRPEEAMVEAMLRGWRAQQMARGLHEDSILDRELLIRRFLTFTNGIRGSGPRHMWMGGRHGCWPNGIWHPRRCGTTRAC